MKVSTQGLITINKKKIMKRKEFFFCTANDFRCQLEKNENTHMKLNKGTHKETRQEICSRYTHK